MLYLSLIIAKFRLSTFFDNIYGHFTPEVRGKVLLLKLILRDWPPETYQNC